jgi:hypothetical protein
LLRKALSVCALCFLLLPVNSYAKIKAGSIETGLSFGWLLVDEEAGSDDKVFGRFDLGFNFTENIGAELSLANSLDSVDHIPDISFYSLALTLNMAPDSDINPYLLLGAGVGNFNTDVIDNESKFAVHGGAGIKFFFDDTWALKIDLRDYMTTDEAAHNFAGSIGLMASFDVFAPEAGGVPFFAEEPAMEKKGAMQEGELEKAGGTEPEMAVTEEEAAKSEGIQEIVERPEPETAPRSEVEGIEAESAITGEKPVEGEVVQEMTAQPQRETAQIMEAGTVKGLEEVPEDKIVILHKGAQLLVRFPYRRSDIDSELFDLLLQLVSYSSKRDIEAIKIVGYSYDYDEIQAAREINSKRERMIRDFILKHSDVQESKIKIVEQDEETYNKFKTFAEGNQKDINRLYIVISFD